MNKILGHPFYIFFLSYEIITLTHSSMYVSHTRLMYSHNERHISHKYISDRYHGCNWDSHSDDPGIELFCSRERAILVYGTD